jgi:protocatechuate 3,4-dioxygenase beta subunit
MRSTNSVLRVLTLLVFCAVQCAAQGPTKDSSASISGRVTIGGKAAAGVTVVATVSNSVLDNKTVAKSTTDEEGNYKLSGLAAGRFTVLPLAKSYVVANDTDKDVGQTVNVAEGETVTKIDFPLVRGGVITGRITDVEGHPLINERVSVVPKDSPADTGPQIAMLGGSRNQTDDRGVYRFYGLGPGSYKVSVGQVSSAGGAVSIMGMGGSQYLKTFYPGVQDEAKATLIEIKEGTEVKDVDISVGKPDSGFSVSGRVVDSESGNPVPNLFIGHSSVNESNQQLAGMGFTGNQTDANGRFRLEGLRPGRYAVFTLAVGQANSFYSEPVQFDISDGDVTGIEIKVRRGATINGVAVIENNSDPAVSKLLQTVSLYAYVEQKGLPVPSYGQSQIAPDGSFHFDGLAPGKARIGVGGFPAVPKGLTLVKTELDLVEQPDGIEVTAGAQINGVRLVFAYGSGSIRGEVKIESGSLPEGVKLHVWVRSNSGDSHRFNRMIDCDARLHFLVENIPPGNYELVVSGQAPGAVQGALVEYLKQTVTVSNGAEVKVTLVVDLNAKKAGQP